MHIAIIILEMSISLSTYDNSKQLRRDSSFSSLKEDKAYVQARTPSEIISSFSIENVTLKLVIEVIASIICIFVGCYLPKVFQYNGFLIIRPIPYQVTQAGDVLIDFTLANELIPKSEAQPSRVLSYGLSLCGYHFVYV